VKKSGQALRKKEEKGGRHFKKGFNSVIDEV